MTEDEFKIQLLIAIKQALGVVMIKPEWILGHIWPVIQKYLEQNSHHLLS